MYFKLKILLLAVFLQGCQNYQSEKHRLINDSHDKLLCEFNFDEFNNRIYDFWLQETDPPSVEEVKDELYAELQKKEDWSHISKEDQAKISTLVAKYYQFLTEKITASLPSTQVTTQTKLQQLAALELGDHTSEKQALQEQWKIEKQKFTSEVLSLQLPLSSLCLQRSTKVTDSSGSSNSSPSASSPEEPLHNKGALRAPGAIEGLHRVLATAYQSCDVLQAEPVSSKTPSLQGIKVFSETHKSGRGRQRVYQDIQKIFQTNPYYALNTPIREGCFDNATQPLIYDFGGKPNTTTDANSKLDLFTNAGSGTNVLGIDCSGFIFSAIARGGLKLAPNKTLKAVLVHGTSARMFKNPSKNGMTCFDSVVDIKTTTIQPGDIIASDGHIVMVDRVGDDPLGLKRAKNAMDCNPKILTSNGFDFVVSQSTPWKNGMGIQQSVAKDYLMSSTTFQKGLVQLAQYFCQQRFKTANTTAINIEPSLAAKPDLSGIDVIRHKGTTECLATKPIALSYESCVDNCQWE